MSLNLGRKHNNSKASLEQRVNELERLLSRRMSVQALPNIGDTQDIKQVAHGLYGGQAVIKTGDNWVVFNPFGLFDDLSIDPTGVGRALGIVERTSGSDRAVIRLAGSYVYLDSFLDGANTEIVLPGQKLYAKEVGGIPGELTHVPQPSGFVVGFALTLTTMIVAPHRDSDAIVVKLTGALVGGQVTLVMVSGANAVGASAATVGGDDTKVVGVAYLASGTEVLIAMAGTIRTDALSLIWGDGAVWIDPATSGAGVTAKPVVPVTQEWRPTRVARQINNRLTVHGGHLSSGLRDLFDIDITTVAPVAGDTIKFDTTDKRWKPGPGGLAGNADGPSVIARQVAGVGPVTAFMTTANEQVLFRSGGILQWDKIGVAQLKNTPAYTVLANGTSATAALTELAAIDGTILGRVGTELKFGSNPQLGTAAAGLGYLKIHFAVGKYWELDATGKMTVYQTATSKVEILANSSIKFTWGSSNTLTIDPADAVGSSRVFKIREIDVCNSSGISKKMQLICTDMY